MDELVEHAYQLSLQMTALDNNFAVQQLSSNFDDDIAQMEKNLKDVTDTSSRREFDQTLKSLQTRKAQLKSVSTLLSRFEAQLTGTNNAVDSVVTGVVSMNGEALKAWRKRFPPCSKS